MGDSPQIAILKRRDDEHDWNLEVHFRYTHLEEIEYECWIGNKLEFNWLNMGLSGNWVTRWVIIIFLTRIAIRGYNPFSDTSILET